MASLVSKCWLRKPPPCTRRVSSPSVSGSGFWFVIGHIPIERARPAQTKNPGRLGSRVLTENSDLLAVDFTWSQAGRPNHHDLSTPIASDAGLSSDERIGGD